MERKQNKMAELTPMKRQYREIKQQHLLDDLGDFPVYVDSPLAVEATGVFNKNVSTCFSDEASAIFMRCLTTMPSLPPASWIWL